MTELEIQILKKKISKLKEKETYFHDIFLASPVALFLVDLDGKVIDCNPAMERLSCKRKEDIINFPVETSYIKTNGDVIRKKLVDETIKKGYVHEFEAYFIRFDGKSLPVIVNTALIMDKGTPSYIVCSASDIMKLKKYEKDLKKVISIFGKTLSIASKGNLTVKIDLKKIGKKYRLIAENINDMIMAIRLREAELLGSLDALRNREQDLMKSKVSVKYFKDYSEKVLMLAEGWGMGNVFKRKMKEWEKKSNE